MTRALVVAALVGGACGQPSNVPVTTRPAGPTCPAVPSVDMSLCPLERPQPSLVVTEPRDDTSLLRGSGFWCTEFRVGKLAGETTCFRYRKPCEKWQRRFHKRNKTTACRPVERASCVKITNYEYTGLFYRCFLPDQCESIRADMVSKRPDLVFSECQEFD